MNKNKDLENIYKEEYAKEYTSEEKTRLMHKLIIFFIIFSAIMQFIFVPLLAKFAITAHNIKFLGISGTEILLYGIFIGIPLLVIGLLTPLFIKGINSIKQKQYPPKETKVFKKTKITRGKKAIAKGLIILLSCFIAIAPLTVLGYTSLNILLNNKNRG